jgi:hypothetical protein
MWSAAAAALGNGEGIRRQQLRSTASVRSSVSAVGARLQSTRNQMSFITHNQMSFIVEIMQEFSTRETWHTAASCSKFGGYLVERVLSVGG